MAESSVNTGFPQVRFVDVATISSDFSTYTDYYSYDDLNMYYDEAGSSFEDPTPRRILVDVPFKNGKSDITRALTDRIFYENRKIKLHFLASYFDISSWESFRSTIMNALHGKALNIVIGNDLFYWQAYEARVTNIDHGDDGIATVDVECDCFPYKLKVLETENTYNVTNATYVRPGSVREFSLSTRMEVNPTFVVRGGPVDIKYERDGMTAISVSMSVGNHTYDNIVFDSKVSTLSFKKSSASSADATLKITYREGNL